MEGFIVDPRKSGPEEFQKGMRDVKLIFAINHTIPYTEEYDNLVKELFWSVPIRLPSARMSLSWAAAS